MPITNGWIIYQCQQCKKTFMLPFSDVKHSEEESKYITCPFHGSHRDISVIGKIDRYGEIKSCMQHESYAREKGRMKQKR